MTYAGVGAVAEETAEDLLWQCATGRREDLCIVSAANSLSEGDLVSPMWDVLQPVPLIPIPPPWQWL